MRKIALITGVSGGIGSAIAQECIKNNIFVIGLYFKKYPDVFKGNDSVCLKKLDITDSRASEKLIKECLSEGLVPNILINNAGIVCDAMFHKMTLVEWERVMFTNLVSLFNLGAWLWPAEII